MEKTESEGENYTVVQFQNFKTWVGGKRLKLSDPARVQLCGILQSTVHCKCKDGKAAVYKRLDHAQETPNRRPF
jgi:hypothetical protein